MRPCSRLRGGMRRAQRRSRRGWRRASSVGEGEEDGPPGGQDGPGAVQKMSSGGVVCARRSGPCARSAFGVEVRILRRGEAAKGGSGITSARQGQAEGSLPNQTKFVDSARDDVPEWEWGPDRCSSDGQQGLKKGWGYGWGAGGRVQRACGLSQRDPRTQADGRLLSIWPTHLQPNSCQTRRLSRRFTSATQSDREHALALESGKAESFAPGP